MSNANGESAREDVEAVPLSEFEVGALARRLVAEHVFLMPLDGIEWEDVPLLVENDWHRLCSALRQYAADLHILSRRYDAETGIDSTELLGRVRG